MPAKGLPPSSVLTGGWAQGDVSTRGSPGWGRCGLRHALQSLHLCSLLQLSRDPGCWPPRRDPARLDSPGGWALWTLSLRQRWGCGGCSGSPPGEASRRGSGPSQIWTSDQALPAPHRAVWEAGRPQRKARAGAGLLSSAGSEPVCREPPAPLGHPQGQGTRAAWPPPPISPSASPARPHLPALPSESPHPTPTQKCGGAKRGLQGRARGQSRHPP